MNKWVAESINLASKDGYLDSLHKVYSIADVLPRKIDPEIVNQIVAAHGKGDSFGLVSALLKLKKFPIDDPYVPYLREDEAARNVNPNTVSRIAKRLLDEPVEDVLKACRQPIVSNRQMGELFHKWFVGLGFPRLNADDLRKLDRFGGLDGKVSDVLMLDGTRKDFRDFVNSVCGSGLEKELDVLVKVKGEYIIGEAKYVSAFGGKQDGAVDEAVDRFLLKSQGMAHRIAVLDGVVWLGNNKKRMCQKVHNLEAIAMSSLLIPKFIEEIQTAS